MESGFLVTWKELLIGGIIVLTVYIAELLLWMRGNGARRPASKELAALRQRVAELESRLAKLDGGTPSTASTPAPTPYGKAFTLAKRGVDAPELAASCGISRAEAELIVAMQRDIPPH